MDQNCFNKDTSRGWEKSICKVSTKFLHCLWRWDSRKNPQWLMAASFVNRLEPNLKTIHMKFQVFFSLNYKCVLRTWTLLPEKLKCKLLTTDGDGDSWTDRGNTICPFRHSSNGEGIKSCSSYDQLRKLKHKLLAPSQTWTETDRWMDRQMDRQG